jgi:hypothetical protein
MSLKIKEWSNEESALGHRLKLYINIPKILELFNATEENDKYKEPFYVIFFLHFLIGLNLQIQMNGEKGNKFIAAVYDENLTKI